MAQDTYYSVASSTVTALTTTAAKLIGSPASDRKGVRVFNGAATNLRLKFVDNDAAPPSFASMVTDGYASVIVLPGASHYESCGVGIDVYGVLETGAGNVCAEELS